MGIYTATKPCGCVAAARTTESNHVADVDRWIVEHVRLGYGVARVPDAKSVRWAGPGGRCEHDAPPVIDAGTRDRGE